MSIFLISSHCEYLYFFIDIISKEGNVCGNVFGPRIIFVGPISIYASNSVFKRCGLTIVELETFIQMF